MARVVLEQVSKVFKVATAESITALHRVDLTVEDKELLVLVGPSGCGKTTLLRLIAGLEVPTEGTISIDGRVVNDVEPKDRDIAMVFQNQALYPHLTVVENLAFGLKLRKIPKAEIAQRVHEAAQLLGVNHCLVRRPKDLSGGERQRVALGRALVRKPRLFLFDEPLSNLDARLREQMRTEISRVHQRLGVTMIYVTHDQTEALSLGRRIAVMRNGRIQQVGDPCCVYRHPVNRFVAGFIGSPAMNFFAGRIERGERGWMFVEQTKTGQECGFVLDLTQEPLPALAADSGKPLTLGLRPEHIQPAAAEECAGAGVIATLEQVELTGAESYWRLTTGAHEFVARVNLGEKAVAGQRVLLAFNLEKAHWFDPVSGRALG